MRMAFPHEIDKLHKDIALERIVYRNPHQPSINWQELKNLSQKRIVSQVIFIFGRRNENSIIQSLPKEIVFYITHLSLKTRPMQTACSAYQLQ